jgi:S1-C subfamily serine protease
VDTVNRIVPQLIARGRVVRPDLGFEELDPAYAPSFGSPKGIIVLRVRRGGAAERAGIQGITRSGRRFLLGDVIVGIGSRAVKDMDALLDALETEPLGSTIQLEVLRDGKRLRVPLRLEAAREI